jgi:hypothetical protein
LKNKKWLIILVAIIFLINIAFYVTIRLAKVDELVRDKLSDFLEENLNSDVKIGFFTFNDKQINVSNLEITDNNEQFKLVVKQIYIDYDIFGLLSKKKKDAIKVIKIYDPRFEYSYREKIEKGDPFEIPEIENFFGEMQIYNGRVSINYSDTDVTLKSSWKDIKLICKNTSECNINISAEAEGSGTVFADAKLKNGNIKKIALDIKDWFPEKSETKFTEKLSAKIDVNLNIFDDITDYSVSLKETVVEKYGKRFAAESIEVVGNTQDILLKTVNAAFDEIPLEAELRISEIGNSVKPITGKVSVSQTELNKYASFAEGKIDIEAVVSGSLNKPKVRFTAESNNISSANQNLENVRLNGELGKTSLIFNSINAIWNENPILARGKYGFTMGLDLDVFSNNVEYKIDETTLQGDLTGKILFDKILQINGNISDLSLTNPKFKLKNLSCEAHLIHDSVSVVIIEENKEFVLKGVGNISKKTSEAKLLLRRLSLNNIFDEVALPLVSGNFEIHTDEDKIGVNSFIRVFDRNFGKLDGRFKTNFEIDLKKNTSNLSISSTDAKYNYHPFDLQLNAEGTKDSLRTTTFSLNKEIDLNAWLRTEPKFDFGIDLTSDKLKIREYLKYFMHHYTANEFSGTVIPNISYDSRGDVLGMIKANNFKFGDMNEIQAESIFSGNNNELVLEYLRLGFPERDFFDVRGNMKLKSEKNIFVTGKITDLNLEDVFPEYSGKINSEIRFIDYEDDNVLFLNFEGDDLDLKGLRVDSVRVEAAQLKEKLILKRFHAARKNFFEMSGSGKIGYNFISDEKFPSNDTLKVSFDGDLLKLIAEQTDFITRGKSTATLDLDLGMGENGLSATSGFFYLKKGEMEFPGQIEKADKIYIKFNIADNVLDLTKFKGRMGEGRVYAKNKHDNDDSDLMLGMLNLGKFYVHTNENGLLFHMPWYMPAGSVAKVLIKGRNTDDLVISGPFEDLQIKGDIYGSNGEAIYPENTKNILKLLSPEELMKKHEEKEETEYLPFSLDLMIHIGENVRYVTYPADLLITPDSYLHLKYENGRFSVPNALFTSENGFVDMFGTNLKEDFTEVRINEQQNLIKISGFYYKKAADGTLITMEVFRDKNRKGYSIGGFQFDLTSDDPEDKFMDILAKLRYNRDVSEIAPEQRKTLLQDEVIQIAGLGLETALLDPLISPLENRIRKILRVDYLYLQTEFVRNIFSRYTTDKNEAIPEEEQEAAELTDGELFLDNLSVHIGKYVTRNLMWDYKMHLQKPLDLAVATEMGVYHDLSLRYDLPYQFRIGYKYSILPFDEENTHEISLEKSFRFW